MDPVLLAIAALCATYLLAEAFPYLLRGWRWLNSSNLQRWRETQKRARAAARIIYPVVPCRCVHVANITPTEMAQCPENCEGAGWK